MTFALADHEIRSLYDGAKDKKSEVPILVQLCAVPLEAMAAQAGPFPAEGRKAFGRSAETAPAAAHAAGGGNGGASPGSAAGLRAAADAGAGPAGAGGRLPGTVRPRGRAAGIRLPAGFRKIEFDFGV